MMDRRLTPLLTLPVILIAASALAQAATQEDTLAWAQSLSAAGHYEKGASLLAPYIAAHPDLVPAWLLLAQLQYWSGDVRAAQSTFEAAVEGHPNDADLRLSYARFLMDLGDTAAVRRLLRDGSSVEAETLLGTAAWWAGDLTDAVRHFKSALREDPNQEDARAALLSIESDARPWLRLEGGLGTDTQPLTLSSGKTATGIFLTPLQALHLEGTWTRYHADDTPLQVTQLSAGYRAYWPSSRLDSEFVAGIHRREDDIESVGSASVAVRLPHALRLRGKIDRSPYYYTESSIRTPVMISAINVTLSLDRSGWLGETAFHRDRYPDSNIKNVAYGWLVAPVVRSERLTLMAGYAFSYQDAAESRFAPVLVTVASPGRPPEWEGRYQPYYTPLNWQAHSAAGSLSLRLRKGVGVTANGAFAVAAREEAPFIYQADLGSAPLVGFYRHWIHPWNVRVGLAADLTSSVVFEFEGNLTSTTWYEAANAEISLLVRL